MTSLTCRFSYTLRRQLNPFNAMRFVMVPCELTRLVGLISEQITALTYRRDA